MMFGTKLSKILASAAVALAWVLPASAQDNYPTRPVEVIVPYDLGGSYSAIMRALTDPLSQELGQPISVVNKPGSAGIIGTKYVAGAKPDGYTILFAGVSPLALAPNLPDGVPYDMKRDFAAVSLIGEAPYFLIANPRAANSVQDMIEKAKAHPGELSYASSGTGSMTDMAMVSLMAMTGIDMVQIPYPGVGPSIIDLLEGRVQFSFAPESAVPHVKSGDLKALAVSTQSRSKLMPDVPTVAEAGVPGFDTSAWYAVVAPAGTPDNIVRKLNTAINKALKSEAFLKQATALGLAPTGGTPEDATRKIATDLEKWKQVVEKSEANRK